MTARPTEDAVKIGAEILIKRQAGTEVMCRIAVDEILSAFTRERLVLVPMSPSEEMLAHGISAAWDTGLDGEDGIGPSDIENIYRAMIPAPPATGGEDGRP